MNVSDSDIIRSILLNHNRNNNGKDQNNQIMNTVVFDETTDEMDADVLLVSVMLTWNIYTINATLQCHNNICLSYMLKIILSTLLIHKTKTNTCAIRENAENKVWHRLRELRALDTNKSIVKKQERKKIPNKNRIIGVSFTTLFRVSISNRSLYNNSNPFVIFSH